jgi:predicted TIM-barrel fold metal-dependent hydrolase
MDQGRSATCPIIDMHGHLGPLPGAYLPAAPVPRMKKYLERAGVTRIVCSPHLALLGDLDRGNRLMQETIDDDPEIFLGYWVVNPNVKSSLSRALRDFEASRGFIGFKFLPDYHQTVLDAGGYAPILEYADAKKAPILIHTWGWSAYNSVQHVENVARRHPHAVLIMGHSGYGDWESAVRVAAQYPNVFLELTAVYVAHDFAMFPAGSGTPLPAHPVLQVNGVIEYMVQGASSKKILYGTDMPWYSPHFAAGAVLFARISDEARMDILFRNAKRLIEGTPAGKDLAVGKAGK